MNEFKGPWEYRVDPIRAEWLTGVQARAAIDAWMNRTEETGAPTFTVSRRPRAVVQHWIITPQDEPETLARTVAQYLADPCDTCGHTLNWHTGPRRICEAWDQYGPNRLCTCAVFVPKETPSP